MQNSPTFRKFEVIKKAIQIELDFIVDKLTNSIINVISGDSFQTEVARLRKADLKNITKKIGWNFNWKSEFQDISKEVYKLTIVGNPVIIQGLLSISIMDDHVYMNLLENAPFNMGIIKEPKGVDFIIQSPPLTKEEQKEISEFIKHRKLQRIAEQKAKKSKPTAMRKKKEPMA